MGYEDDVDSNDELNDRNEDPDEDDDESDDDERYYCGYGDDEDVDLGSGMRGLGLASSEDDGLSSDEDQLLYTKTYEEDDANRSGIAYARFKKQMMKEFYDDDEDED